MSNEKNFKSGFVTIIGRPNVGKSTLMNQLIGQKIAITSNKPQTTRNRIQTVYTETDRGQLVFVDTPGMHKAKNKLGEYMMEQVTKSITDVDAVMVLVEPSEKIGPKDKAVIESLQNVKCPVLLCINKIDSVEPEVVPKAIEAFSALYDFTDIIPVSAKNGTGCGDVIDTLFKYMPYGPMYFDEDTVTDMPIRAIVAEIIREKALHALNDEVPHGIVVLIDIMKQRPGRNVFYDIEATIVCERDSHKGIIIGKGGEMLKKIGSNARYEIERLVEGKVNLKIWVKVKKDWRDSEYLVKNFGYSDPDK